MRLSLPTLSGARVTPLPDWLKRVAPCRLWLEDDAVSKASPAEYTATCVPPSAGSRPNAAFEGKMDSNAAASSAGCLSVFAVENAQPALGAADKGQNVLCTPLRRVSVHDPHALLHPNGLEQAQKPCSTQPVEAMPFAPSQKPLNTRRLGHTSNRGQCWDLPSSRIARPNEDVVSSNGCEQLKTVVNLKCTTHLREERSSYGCGTTSRGVTEGNRRHPADGGAPESDTGMQAFEEKRTVMHAGHETGAREADKAAKLAFVGSWRHDLIKHLIRLKRRSDIRRDCGSILLLGYPLIRFMSSPWFFRLASRQAGGLLPASRNPDRTPCSVPCAKAKDENAFLDGEKSTSQGDSSTARERNSMDVPVSKSSESCACEDNSTSRFPGSKEPELRTVKFDLLVTDNMALVKNPSSHQIHCSEAVYASPAAVNFLMRRNVPEYLRTQGRASLKINGPKRKARKNQVVLCQKSFLAGTQNINAVAVLGRPTEKQELGNVRCLLALDRVKYVGNVGVLVRAAAAFGFDGIFYIDGTADPFNWKVMEVSNGLHYNLPHFRGSAADLLAQCKRESLLPVVADTKGLSTDCLHAELTSFKGICCILGNESYGADDVLLRHCKRICLPMSDLVESLNVAVAGGILMYEVKKLLEHVGTPKRMAS